MELHERLASTVVLTANGNGKHDPHAEIKNRIHFALVSELGPRLFGISDSTAIRATIVSEIREQLRQEDSLTSADRERLAAEIAADILGYGPLDTLLADETVSEIMVNGADQIWVEREGRLYETPLHFDDESHVRRIIAKMVGGVGRRIDESSPMVDARLPDGSRVNAIIPPLSLSGHLLTIRKFAQHRFRYDELMQERHAVRRRRRVSAARSQGEAEHAHLRRNRQRQDDAAERALAGDPGQRPDRHDRGRGRAAALAAARDLARGPPQEHRRRRRGDDPRPRPQRPADAA